MWNDTDAPLAFLITFRCYGTWLHGDERGSVDRHNNTYGSPYNPPIEHWKTITADRMKHDPVKLNAAQRDSVRKAIIDTCRKRGWGVYAVNVRINHAHAVVSLGGAKPETALSAFKANATRQMREDSCWPHEHSPWVEKGSKRYLWNERHIDAAVEYVNFGQGRDLPQFD